MAKKKAPKKNRFEEPVYNEIEKKMGNVITLGNELLDNLNDLKVLSFSPALDLALGGGIREGTCTIISGDPKTCKSSSVMHFVAKAQAVGKNIGYLDVENRLVKENFKGIKGLDAGAMAIMKPTIEKPKITAEDYLNGLEMMVNSIPNFVGVVDSTSTMLPSGEMHGDIELNVRPGTPRLLSMFLKRIAGPVSVNKAILIFITHNITNTNRKGPWSPEKKPDSGVKIQYQASNNMIITHAKSWEANGREIGKAVNWKILTSAAGGFPNTKATSWFRYNLGIDETKEVIEIAADFSLISVSGSWYKITYAVENKDHPVVKKILDDNNVDASKTEDVEKFFNNQGIDNLTQFLEKHQDLKDLIQSEISEMLNEG